MLKFLRKKTKIIIWTVVVAFVAWGGYSASVQFEQANRAPGKIFGKEVSFRDYQIANRAAQIFSPSSKENEPPKPGETEAKTWQFLILSHEAKNRKIVVSDDEVRQEITHLLTQKENSTLTGEQYLQWVRATLHEEPREFENQLREQLRIQKLVAELRKGAAGHSEKALNRKLAQIFRHSKIEVYRSSRP